MFFISISSIGYLFASIVSLVTGLRLLRAYNISRSVETKYLSIVLLVLSATMFLYAFPTFWFSTMPTVLGWFNVLANLTMGVWLAYLFRLAYHIHKPHAETKKPFLVVLFWGVIILPAVNILYLPAPTFDRYTLEIWNYDFILWLNTGFVIMVFFWYLSYSLLKRYHIEGGRGYVVYILASAFIIGSLGGGMVTYTVSTFYVLIGYILLFFGGFTVFTISFLK